MYLILSDLHIGDKHANKFLPGLFDLLESFSKMDYHLILNGDIFDFVKCLNFDERHRTFLSIIQKYKSVIYIEGNHDWFISGIEDALPHISFKKELLLKFNNKIIRIIHGHQTDKWATKRAKLTRFLIKLNDWIYKLINIDIQHWVRKTWLVQKFFLKRQERRLIRNESVANIIIAGHTHRPCVRNEDGTLYYNTGDWVEKNHSAYITIDNDGNIELTRYKQERQNG
jgi:UDP-2,3-diacylglucosamine pyrophosphatase LpxH